jgi:hypothetical protein
VGERGEAVFPPQKMIKLVSNMNLENTIQLKRHRIFTRISNVSGFISHVPHFGQFAPS